MALACTSTPQRVIAVGDIACDPADPEFANGNGSSTRCHMQATSALAQAQDPHAVLLLGDLQYESGTLEAFQTSFDPSWGALNDRAWPVPGNHEYVTPGAQGYFDYFGARAGETDKGYYSFEVGDWHLIALNSNCADIGGCEAGSPQEAWLRADLAASSKRCTLAFWHHPRFSSSQHGNQIIVDDLWKALAEANADLVLNGHDHAYERFADPSGIREFVVGTGGKSLYPDENPQPNSEVRFHDVYGVLELTLRDQGYDWEFLAEGGESRDSGSASCD